MLSLSKGTPIAKDGRDIIYIYDPDQEANSDSDSDSGDDLDTDYEAKQKIEPLIDIDNRDVIYIAGPAGSGKSTMAVNFVKNFLKIYPSYPFYLFSRTHHSTDPVFSGMRVNQVMIDESLIKDPIDITKELTDGCIVLFDDVNTVQNDKVKKAVNKLLDDILECGRRIRIWCLVTNHLVIPNERKEARTILNEMKKLVVFPKSGSSQQITYALKTYFGLGKHQIAEILQHQSRWVLISKQYPMYVMHDKGIYIL
jgi:dynein-related subfamily AAA family protein